MRISALMLAVLCAACSTTGAANGPSGAVERKDASTLLVTEYANHGFPKRSFVVPSSNGNYDAYLDMIGGDLRQGERKEIPCFVGRLTMLPNGDIVETGSGPEAMQTLKPGTAGYDKVRQIHPDLTPGHFRGIRC